MPAASKHSHTLCASISIVENGLFHASYRAGVAGSEVKQLPAYQLGKSLSDARRQIERSAHLLGYESIVWDEEFDGLMD
jgi:hypothetical protein